VFVFAEVVIFHQRTENPCVGGSIPPLPISSAPHSNCCSSIEIASVGQLSAAALQASWNSTGTWSAIAEAIPSSLSLKTYGQLLTQRPEPLQGFVLTWAFIFHLLF